MPKVRDYTYDSTPASADAIAYTDVTTNTTKYTTFGDLPGGSSLGGREYEVVTFPSTVAQADNASAWRCPATGTLVKVDIWCDVAPVTAAVTVDLHKNGTTVFTTQSNRPSIATSSTADDSGTPEVTSMVAGDLFQLQIDSLNASDQGDIGQLMCRITWDRT